MGIFETSRKILLAVRLKSMKKHRVLISEKAPETEPRKPRNGQSLLDVLMSPDPYKPRHTKTDVSELSLTEAEWKAIEARLCGQFGWPPFVEYQGIADVKEWGKHLQAMSSRHNLPRLPVIENPRAVAWVSRRHGMTHSAMEEPWTE